MSKVVSERGTIRVTSADRPNAVTETVVTVRIGPNRSVVGSSGAPGPRAGRCRTRPASRCAPGPRRSPARSGSPAAGSRAACCEAHQIRLGLPVGCVEAEQAGLEPDCVDLRRRTQVPRPRAPGLGPQHLERSAPGDAGPLLLRELGHRQQHDASARPAPSRRRPGAGNRPRRGRSRCRPDPVRSPGARFPAHGSGGAPGGSRASATIGLEVSKTCGSSPSEGTPAPPRPRAVHGAGGGPPVMAGCGSSTVTASTVAAPTNCTGW